MSLTSPGPRRTTPPTNLKIEGSFLPYLPNKKMYFVKS